ncbi:8-oxo-dGTP pyrophosphatase MutT (NUDIX family) [Angulomicrobium amanitiforme]|uniref:8-oxo-dGTP pyrophosphatase MutT (NUDIX family) n=1 Tax=Ancylobacter amanitiformis TaxID=217069 RepID=A0ABU0LLY0_9HYPH|nr:8-oxo-dGTP pyrophosphatase MutT (NUDIX family) [Ancylobacter amanitiformis]
MPDPAASATEIPASEILVTLDDFLARARTRLLAAPDLTGEPPRGDHELTPEFRGMVDALAARTAAVLIPVIARPRPTVLLTLRSSHLPDHAGQIAFPGGKIDPQDTGPLDAALREAEEEVGLGRGFVAPLGYLDAYLSRTGFRIVPVVGLVQPDFGLTLNPGEVDEAFEVPLDFLMSPANHQRESREWLGLMRSFHAITYEKRRIWGITGGILRSLYDRIYG